MTPLRQRIESSFKSQGLMMSLGAELVLVDVGEVHVRMPFDKKFSQQQGFIHAGAITSIVDSACGYAAMTKAPDTHEVVTVEFKVNFVRPAIGQYFLAIGKVQTSGKQLSVCTGEVIAYYNGQEKVVALMQTTMMNVQK